MATKREPILFNRNFLANLPLFRLSGLPEVVATSGISIRLWHVYAQTWLLCLAFPILELVRSYANGTYGVPARLLIPLLGLAIFVTAYTWFMWPHPLDYPTRFRSGQRTSLITLAGLTALVLWLSLAYGSAFLWLFVGLSAMIGMMLPAFSAFLVIVAMTLLTLGIGVGLSGGVAKADWLHLLPLALLVRGLGLDMIGVRRLSDALRELHLARTELARQAVTEERLRLARDLHDLLGHTLSMITLKSELAGRLIEKDPLRAAQEIHEIEREARHALREVREAVAGYRQPNLRGELESARQILGAAEIECRIDPALEALAAPVDAALAWTVREGVTNVIRHSRARRCLVRVKDENGYASVEVINDGYRERKPSVETTGTSSGLAGLAERVSERQGRLEYGPLMFDGVPGFYLRVEIPVGEYEAAQQGPPL